MRIAICLSGHARTFRETYQCWQSFRRAHAGDDVRMFIATWSESDFVGKTWWRVKHHTEILTQADLMELEGVYAPCELQVRMRPQPMVRSEYAYIEAVSTCKPSNVEQSWWLNKLCFDMIRDLHSYDFVIRSRPDVQFNDFTLRDLGQDELGMVRTPCDVMFYGRPQAMQTAMQIAERFPWAIVDRQRDVMRGDQLIPEQVFGRWLAKANIKIRADDPNWRVYLNRGPGEYPVKL